MENKQYKCTVCDHVFDENTDGKWADLPKYWNCPECGCAREEYEEVVF